MVLLGLVYRTGSRDFRGHIQSLLDQDSNQFFGNLTLMLIQVVDGGSVLGTDIGTLTIDLSRIVRFKKEPRQRLVIGLGRIPGYLNHFVVTSRSPSYFPVRRFLDVAA